MYRTVPHACTELYHMSTGHWWNDVLKKEKCLKKNWTKQHIVYYKSYVEHPGTEPRSSW